MGAVLAMATGMKMADHMVLGQEVGDRLAYAAVTQHMTR